MRPRVALYGLALALLFAAAPSRAEQVSDWKDCFGQEQGGTFPGFIPTNAATIPACTRLLNGGRLNAEDQSNALFRRADAFRGRTQFARAIADYDRMIALGGPRADRTYYNRGITYDLMGRRAEAIRDLQRVAQSTDPIVAEAARKALKDIADRASPKPGTQGLPRQRDDSSLIDELRRKANARQQENGFCSRVPWPDLTWEQVFSFFDRSVAGSWHVDKDDIRCQIEQVVSIGNFRGDKCVRTQIWVCHLGKECRMFFSSRCKQAADYNYPGCSCQ